MSGAGHCEEKEVFCTMDYIISKPHKNERVANRCDDSVEAADAEAEGNTNTDPEDAFVVPDKSRQRICVRNPSV
jgi:hypothetical protein